jgi:hypothetical protein
MSYRVVWRGRLRTVIQTVVFSALERGADADAITRAVTEIDRRLAADPTGEGESREGAERAVTVSPLTVVYEVFEAERVVLIYDAVYYPRFRL